MALTQSQVSQLYVTLFGRASEGAGNTYWQTAAADLAQGATDMLATQAAEDYFGSSLDTDQAFIEYIYLNTLGKTYAEDTDGVDYWVGLLADGATRGEVTAALIEAVYQYADDTDPVTKAAYEQFVNRVAVSDYCADNIEGADLDASDDAAMAVFSEYIEGVTDDAATVTAAEEAIDGYDGSAFTLTNDTDIATANVFTAPMVYTPGGNDRINSLQDEDVLTGTGDNPTLNATLGNANDNGSTVITPELINIETLNVAFTGSGANNVTGLDLQDSSGLAVINISRVAQNENAEVGNITTAAATLSLKHTNANAGDTVEFSYAAGVLAGASPAATILIDDVQLGTLAIGQNQNMANNIVQTNSFEDLTITSTGGSANRIGTLNLPMDTGNDGKVTIIGDQDLSLATNVSITNGVAPNATLVEAITHAGGIALTNGRMAAIDASALEGNFEITLGNGSFTATKAGTSGQVQNLIVTGGSGDDTFYLADTIQAGDSLVGGDGTDKIAMVNGGVINAQSSVVSGVEQIRADMNNTATTIDFDKLPDVVGVTVRNVSFNVVTNNSAVGTDVFNLNNLNATQAAGITVEHSTSLSNGITQNTINAGLKVETGATDTVAIAVVDPTQGANVDPRFNFTLNAGGTAAAVGVENLTFNDSDTESNTVALGRIAKHTGTITINSTTGNSTFFNLDTSSTGVNGGIYNYLINGQETAADSTTGDGWLDGGTTAIRNLGITDLSATAAQDRLIAATINASASTSNVVVRVDTARLATGVETSTGGQNITMGAGNDTVIFDKLLDTRAGLTISDTVAGGLGNDTLVLDGNLAAGVINISASEWTNVSGFETVRLVGAGAGTYGLTLTDSLIAANNNAGMLAIVNDNNPVTDTANMLAVAGPSATSAVVIDARSLSATTRFSYNGAEGAGATQGAATGDTNDRIILSDANINGGNIIDGGADWNNDGLIATIANAVTGSIAGVTYDANVGGAAGNGDIIEVRNAAIVTVGDLANIKNIGTLSFTNDTAAVVSSVLQLNDTVVDSMVNSYHTSSATAIGGVSQVERLFINAIDNPLLPAAWTQLNVDASALTAKSAITVTASGGVDTIVGGAGADVITGGGSADVLTGGAGADTFIYGATITDSNISTTATAAAGFDTVSVAATDIFDFNAAVVAVIAAPIATGLALGATGTLVIGQLNAAFTGADDGVANVESAVITFAGGQQYMVVDSDGDQAITAADNVVQLLGTVTGISINAGNVLLA